MDKKVKKIPMRQCMGCNEHKPKGELIRVVRSPEGDISLDFTGRKNGRGAYLCRSVACLRKAAKSRRIDRVLECTVPESVWAEMEREIEADGDR
ncbi:MAG: YlxR family protein [Eubacteriales bacterium]|nr:YlxR family protein [Eubacteriales bacterium]